MKSSKIPRSTVCLAVTMFSALLSADERSADTAVSPLTASERSALTTSFEAVLQQNPSPAGDDDNAISVHSRRGDALFFLQQFDKAVDEYQAMVKLDPSQDASHWRLGIALFFANQPQEAVAQFEKYHAFDDVDRENGIWRYLSQYKAAGADLAKKELLRYEKDDREPFPAVYQLFDGSLTPEAALATISDELPELEKDKRLFYTELYIGMHAVVQGQHDAAEDFLRLAVSRRWPRNNGFGPNYMWHVARVQWEQLRHRKKSP
ncbi:MAG: tetratricopeptide repeat protein [Planctomycetaceae bacterium]